MILALLRFHTCNRAACLVAVTVDVLSITAMQVLAGLRGWVIEKLKHFFDYATNRFILIVVAVERRLMR